MAHTACGQDDVILTTIPEGPLGTEVPVGAEVTEEMEDIKTEESNGGPIPADEHMHEHHDHEHMLTENCLRKSEAIGTMMEGEDMMFDLMDAITLNLMADHMPWEYYVCIDQTTNQLMALQLSFADMDGEDVAKLPLIGQNTGEGLLCGDFKFMDRDAPVSVILFEEDMMVSGLGITYDDNENGLVKMGTTAPTRLEIMMEGNELAGFYGSVN